MNFNDFFKNYSRKLFTRPADDILYKLFKENKQDKKYLKSDYELILNEIKDNVKKYLNIVKSKGKYNLTDLKKLNDKLKDKTPNIKYIYDEEKVQLSRYNLNNKEETNILKGLLKQWSPKKNISFNKIIENIKMKKDYKFNNKDITQTTEPIENKNIDVNIDLNYYVDYNGEYKIRREETTNYKGKIKDLYNFIYQTAKTYIKGFDMFSNQALNNIIIYDEIPEFKNYDDEPLLYCIVEIKDIGSDTNFYISTENQRLRENKFYNICNLYNEVVNIEPTNNNCVKEYLKKYTDISNKKIDNLGNKDGVSANEIYNLCKEYNLKCVLYDIDGKIIKANYPTKKTNKKNIIGICYNNHFYGMKNEVLKKNNPQNKETIIKTKEEINKIFDEQLNNYIIPSNIHLDKYYKIGSFTNDNKIYFSNDDYNKCLEILEIYGLKDKMMPSINLINISDIIEKLYIKDNISSFFPIKIRKSAYVYYNNDIDHEKYIKDYITEDKNKFYSWILKELPYLIKLDYRQSNINFYNKDNQPKNINDKYLYIVKPKLSSILLLNTNIYSGYHLKYCKKEGFEFEILEEIETETTENYYKNFIIDLYNKIDHTTAKNIINSMIGRFQKDPQLKYKYKIIKISNGDERAGDLENNYIKYNNNLYFKYEKEEQYKNIYNKKPIAIQIKDMASIALYEKIKSLNLKNDELISIETDAITYINSGQYENHKNELDEKDINKWKRIYKNIDYFKKHLGYENETQDQITSFKNVLFSNPNNNNILFDCYAGAGKSYRIKNEIIPKLGNDYIIITPQHSVNKPYKKLGLNCAVIQTFIYSGKLPYEKYIIIDEIGLFNKQANDFLFKCMMTNKIIYSLGDFKQLLPIFEKSHFNKEYYFKFLYGTIYNINTNYRNNFKKDYYDKLMNEEINLINEVKKISISDYKKAEIIICISNNEVEKYNKLMMEYLNKKFDDIGAKIICKTNKLKHKEIFNNDDFIILEYDEQTKIYKIDDNLYITKEELNKNFSPNYAITLYKAQGQEFNNFFFGINSYNFLNGRSAYTLISRKKEELTKETFENNKNILNNITIKY